MIDQLEFIKVSPNYDQKLVNLKPQNLIKTPFITCFDMFDTNNVKNMGSKKMIYGCLNGSVAIFDIEAQRVICEKSLGKNRIENIATSTVKYFDTYISRIGIVLRGESNIHILNHFMF